MKSSLKHIALVAAGLGLSGCAYEAGSQLDTGWFGEATMHNTLAQACNGAGGAGGKGGKAGATVDPLVVLDPTSTATRPIYRVHCDGQLNGKYAQVIFREYIVSAEPPPRFGIEVDASAE